MSDIECEDHKFLKVHNHLFKVLILNVKITSSSVTKYFEHLAKNIQLLARLSMVKSLLLTTAIEKIQL